MSIPLPPPAVPRSDSRRSSLSLTPAYPPLTTDLESIAISSARGLIRIQGEAHPLQDPVRNVLRGKEIGFKNQADPHGIPSGGGGVDRRPEGVLHRKKGVRAESKVKLKAAQSCLTLYNPMDYIRGLYSP